MDISPEEAARALGDIEASRAAMRAAIRNYRGHYFLWLWGGIWVAMALRAEFHILRGLPIDQWLALAGNIATLLIIFAQRSRIRSTGHGRFLGMLATTIIFAYLWPQVLGGPPNHRSGFAYGALMAMFCYIMAGIWFDIYLFWLGIVVSALILAGLFLFPAFFWWVAILSGCVLIGTGFYVRFFWR